MLRLTLVAALITLALVSANDSDNCDHWYPAYERNGNWICRHGDQRKDVNHQRICCIDRAIMRRPDGSIVECDVWYRAVETVIGRVCGGDAELVDTKCCVRGATAAPIVPPLPECADWYQVIEGQYCRNDRDRREGNICCPQH